jgi:hypothetical protein
MPHLRLQIGYRLIEKIIKDGEGIDEWKRIRDQIRGF